MHDIVPDVHLLFGSIYKSLVQACCARLVCHAVQAAGIVCLGYALLALAHEGATPSLGITMSPSPSKLSEELNTDPDH